MNKAVVIFESKYGSTKRYAEWIAEGLSCPIFERKKFKPQNLANYEIIIYGGGLYAGGVNGIKLITQNWNVLSNKKVILFTCGIANPADSENVSNIRKSLARVLSPEMLEHICLFHFRGGIDYSRLTFIHKSMMSMLRKMLLEKEEHTLSEEDRRLLETYGKCVNYTDRNSIESLIDCVLKEAVSDYE